MQTELIDTFLDLIETRSFNRTAERLGVTQSTVSARVRALEEAVGARLFTRSRAGTELTVAGLRFETHARMLRQEWTAARRAVATGGEVALSLRLGIQQDLSGRFLGQLVPEIRRMIPQTDLYVELDYSIQMCAELEAGGLDFALIYTPRPHPDLYFQTVGELVYRLVSSDTDTLAQVAPGRMIFGQFSPAFARAHREALPALSEGPLSVGQTGAVAVLLQTLGGAGYVMERTARDLVAGGLCLVADAPALTQPVYAAMHLRNRTGGLHRRLVRLAQRLLLEG